ncbi:MAG TPA: acetyl-CoA C-acyltransferase family protein [Burkholderiales bacterium]|jgi:acetyl-CoA C-acetyltransferase|nr:acetyl-CoA C-acyltransferase family protein [Burkholderiales bacterium]
MTDVMVVAGTRTAIGDYGGAFKDIPPTKLGSIAIKEAMKRGEIDPATVGHVVMGSVIHGEARDMYLSRVSAVDAGVPVGTPCLTVNRLCGSGLQAIVSAAQHIMLGDIQTAIAGGAESMSRAAYMLPSGRWGQRMGDAQVVDAMTAALHDPFGHGHMGVTAENIAAKYGFTRQQQDEYSVESHKRAMRAINAGYFKSQIVPIELKSKKGVEQFTTDEHVRADASMENMGKLKPVFKKDGTVTAANASGINDAAAAIVLMDAKQAKNHKPMARLVAYAHAGVEPQVMGLGPIPAVKKVFEKAGLKPGDMDVIESNEAFAVQAMAVTKDLGLDPAKVNPNGGAVALGHPIGATGCILTVKALYELQRTQKRYALVTMCIGGGQGIAAIFERV